MEIGYFFGTYDGDTPSHKIISIEYRDGLPAVTSLLVSATTFEAAIAAGKLVTGECAGENWLAKDVELVTWPPPDLSRIESLH